VGKATVKNAARATVWARAYASVFDAVITGARAAHDLEALQNPMVLCPAFDPHARTSERDESGIELSTVQIAQRAARLAADAAVHDCDRYGMLEDG
jgi:hypothetical protein